MRNRFLLCRGDFNIDAFVVLDQNPLKKIAMPLLQVSERLLLVDTVFQFLLHELEAGIILFKYFTPCLYADRDALTLLNQPALRVRSISNAGVYLFVVLVGYDPKMPAKTFDAIEAGVFLHGQGIPLGLHQMTRINDDLRRL